MKFVIKNEIRGRLRIHLFRKKLSFAEAGRIESYLMGQHGVSKVTVYERTADIAIRYEGDRFALISCLKRMDLSKLDLPDADASLAARETNALYKEKLITTVVFHYARRLFVPAPVRHALALVRSVKFIKAGLTSLWHRKLEVSVLDATAITVSLVRGDFDTAGSTMFLLKVGEILEEWTHKRSVNDLAKSMALNIGKVWKKAGDTELLVDASEISCGDEVIVRCGSTIPFDGDVTGGLATVNESSLTGESAPAAKSAGSYAYAGTVVEDGYLTLSVRETGGSTRYERITGLIEDSQKLKSAVESRAEHLADRLVPYTLLGTGLTYLLTRNATKALAVLMVDFSCALKLAMPITVLSAIKEAGSYGITVKGGKYLEAVAEADTIVFDKTGTLTKAKPTVARIVPFCDMSEDELLRIAACLEEHFPHSIAKAVVEEAEKRNLVHEEMHSQVEYIVAHGIASLIGDKRAVIGSSHFVFEDEKCSVREDMKDRLKAIPDHYSHLYMAIDNQLAAVICVEDPLRPEAAAAVRALRGTGIKKVVMMTGDSERTAKAIAAAVGLSEYYSEVLPQDKADYIRRQRELGRKVIMVGDGINDSPALSEADVGIAISDGAAIAREIADITVAADDLECLITLRNIADLMMKRIRKNYRQIVLFNGALIALGVAGIVQPTTSGLLHNTSTLAIGMKSMQPLL